MFARTAFLNAARGGRPGCRGGGFTLIELLVVVAIIGVLISILLPALVRCREQARSAVCMSNLRQVGVGIYNYWTTWNGRVPYVESPMTNGIAGSTAGGGVAGFGNPVFSDSETNPFDRTRWPLSLPNVLMPEHMGRAEKVFVCPSAVNGWPRTGEKAYTYREAAANQPNGRRDPLNRYNSEHFGFLDGRMLAKFRMNLTGDPIRDAMEESFQRGAYIRDMVRRDGDLIIGPHRGGMFLLDRDLQVHYRDQRKTADDLAPNGFDQGSSF